MPLVALSSEPLKIRPKLSQKLTTKLFSMDSSLCRYTLYVDTFGRSLERFRQTARRAMRPVSPCLLTPLVSQAVVWIWWMRSDWLCNYASASYCPACDRVRTDHTLPQAYTAMSPAGQLPHERRKTAVKVSVGHHGSRYSSWQHHHHHHHHRHVIRRLVAAGVRCGWLRSDFTSSICCCGLVGLQVVPYIKLCNISKCHDFVNLL